MMDFVVSKVAMSVCALAVAGVLTGMADRVCAPDHGEILDDMLWNLAGLVASIGANHGESCAEWSVPGLPSGGSALLSIWPDIASAAYDGTIRWYPLEPSLHAWEWDGSPLNRSRIDALDASSHEVSVRSGQTLTILGKEVVTDEGRAFLLFVSGPFHWSL